MPSVAIWILTCASCSGLPVLLHWVSDHTFNALLVAALVLLAASITAYTCSGRRGDRRVGEKETTVLTLYTYASRRGTLALSQTDPLVPMLGLLVSPLLALRPRSDGGALVNGVIVEEGTVISSDSVIFSPPSKHPATVVGEHATGTRSQPDVSSVPSPCELPTELGNQQPTCSKYLPLQLERNNPITLQAIDVHLPGDKRYCEHRSTDVSVSSEDDVGSVIDHVLPNIDDIPKVHRSISSLPPVEAVVNILLEAAQTGCLGEFRENSGRTKDAPRLTVVPKEESRINEERTEPRDGRGAVNTCVTDVT